MSQASPTQTPTLLEVLQKINLQTFEQTKGKIGQRLYTITKVATEPAPANYQVLGQWHHVINDNVATLERLMTKDDLQSLDVQTSVPVDGIMYTIHVLVTNVQARVGRNGPARD